MSNLSGSDGRKRRKTWTCPICGKTLRDRATITGHMNTHNPQAARMDWDCISCGQPQATYGTKMSEARKKVPRHLTCETCLNAATTTQEVNDA